MNVDPDKYLCSLPLKRIAIWAFVLNGLWEFGQCTVLYDMWNWGIWRGAAWMWGAIAGDVVIVLGIVWIASILAGAKHLNPPNAKGWLALISTSFVASVALEWLAQYLQLWSYSALMPVVDVFGFEIGLAPIIQITLLPSLSVFLGFNDSTQRKAKKPSVSTTRQ